jgi:hypothetical protein
VKFAILTLEVKHPCTGFLTAFGMTQNGMLGTSKKMLACPHLVMLSEASMLDSLLALGITRKCSV